MSGLFFLSMKAKYDKATYDKAKFKTDGEGHM
jgi:hypothetical protein